MAPSFRGPSTFCALPCEFAVWVEGAKRESCPTMWKLPGSDFVESESIRLRAVRVIVAYLNDTTHFEMVNLTKRGVEDYLTL